MAFMAIIFRKDIVIGHRSWRSIPVSPRDARRLQQTSLFTLRHAMHASGENRRVNTLSYPPLALVSLLHRDQCIVTMLRSSTYRYGPGVSRRLRRHHRCRRFHHDIAFAWNAGLISTRRGMARLRREMAAIVFRQTRFTNIVSFA